MKTNNQFLASKEKQILACGLILLGVYVLLMLYCALFFPGYLQTLLGITASNIIFGRMAGLSIGIASQMDTTLLVVFNLFIESIMVFILYPLFVMSWNKLDVISYGPLNRLMDKSKASAQRYEPLIKRYGAIGLVLFVLTPLAMTGPVVGSFVGYLISFRHRNTLLLVLFSTLLAIILWVYLIKNFEDTLIRYSDILMSGLLISIGLLGLWYGVKTVFHKSI